MLLLGPMAPAEHALETGERAFAPQRGRIFVEGMDLKELPAEARRRIGFLRMRRSFTAN